MLHRKQELEERMQLQRGGCLNTPRRTQARVQMRDGVVLAKVQKNAKYACMRGMHCMC